MPTIPKTKFELKQRQVNWHRFAFVALIVLGIVHIPFFFAGSKSWSDPTSLRKGILFGISTGLTLWSCHRVFDVLQPKRADSWLRGLLSASLFLEVLLIMVQGWRGQASHFNRVGLLNSTIESGMLILIALATLVISWLTFRCFTERSMLESTTGVAIAPERALALRWGMGYLLVSCLLGFAITWIGKELQAKWASPELLLPRGVLKFPHGAALHALQTLEVTALFLMYFRVSSRRSVRMISLLILGHGLWLAYACVQTFCGRGRWEIPWQT